VKFRRQQGIGPYIADFYVAKLQLVIEIDGESHFNPEGISHDAERDEYMQSTGISILRFTNTQVRENIDGVIAVIQDAISPPAKGEMEGVMQFAGKTLAEGV
jgi:very-short-patch-repair endonuclease